METKIKRPLSVWLTIILFSIFLLIALSAFIRAFYAVFHENDIAFLPIKIKIFGNYLCYILTILFVIAGAIVMIWQGQPRARIIGIILFLSIFVIHLMNISISDSPAYANSAQRGGAFIFHLLITVLYSILFYRFSFSQAARTYFRQNNIRSKPIAIWLSLIVLIYLLNDIIYIFNFAAYFQINNLIESPSMQHLAITGSLSLISLILALLFFYTIKLILTISPKGRQLGLIIMLIGTILYFSFQIWHFETLTGTERYYQTLINSSIYLLFYISICYLLSLSKTVRSYFSRDQNRVENPNQASAK